MAETGGVAVLSPFLSVAFDTVTNRKHKEYKEFLEHQNFDRGLIQNLKTKMIAFSLFVDAAEKKQFGNEEVRKWLLELKDATYKAEDVLDGIQIEYQAHQSKAVSEDQERSSSSQDSLKQEIEPKLQDILDRLEELRQDSDAFGLSKAVGDAAAPPRSFEFEFDVFLNFRGEDVRQGFLYYLRKALEEERINVFYDAEDLGKGEEIDNILKKIEVSKMSIMIFSKKYASSSYCLEELVKIFECKKRWGNEALPIFYHVPPDVVAKQSGIYGKAVRRHEQKGTNSEKLRNWRASLAEAANLSGFVLENKRPEEIDIQEIVKAVKKILEKFDSEKPSSKGRKRSYGEFLGLEKCMEERSSEKRETTSMIDNSEGFYGRDADKKAIIDMLISDDDNGSNPGVIPIVGMGGVGKTTLAQHVFNDKAVAEQFKVREWVCVSDQFDMTNVTKNIVEKLTETTCPPGGLDQIQRKLNVALDGKKFLLVLDDVWSEDYEKWRQLLAPLRSGAKGSKLIITTRSKDVASTVQTVPPRYLKVLEDEDCWKLFARHASYDVNSASNHPELEAIGKEIVRKCGGLPLAARALGGVLRWEAKAEKWKEVLESETWEVQNANILPALAMSYIHLPSHLKRCFVYCAIFPQDYVFQKEELVALWMSEGFLVQQKGKKPLEEIGDMCFDDLVSRSFFQHSSNIWGKQGFAMHDLVHDLARFVSGEFCSRLEGGTSSKIGERTRHLSYQGLEDDGLVIHETPFLRSFVMARKWGCFTNKEFIDGLLQRQKLLRVLFLFRWETIELSNSIGNLKHMRYLNLSDTPIKLLPEAVTDLFNLEILILRGCSELVELPADMARLINLWQLDLPGTRKLKGMPPKMGKLKKLSKLSDFVVGENGGSSIKELGQLHNLGGKISIRGLENEKDDWDASEVVLKDKKNLKVLQLKWEDDSRQAKEVLERLQPHTDIESIKIYRYGGREFPNWVGGISFSKLKELHLCKLRNCILLPPLGQLASLEKLSILGDCNKLRNCIRLPPLGQLASLEKLSIRGNNGVGDDEGEKWSIRGDDGLSDDDDGYYFDDDDDGGGGYNEVLEAIGVEFYGICKPGEKPFSSLKLLEFRRMKNWREWSSCNGAFPTLEELELHDCPKLTSVPSHLPRLKRLRIRNCDEVKCTSLETFPNLKELDIRFCSNLESLVGSTAAATTRTSEPLFFPSLTGLTIVRCSKLVSFPRGGLHAPNLKSMIIEKCDNLKWLPQGMHSLLPSLEALFIDSCHEIESFPEGGLPSKLQSIKIINCKKLVDGYMECPLKSMIIGHSDNLKWLPQGMHSLLPSLEPLVISSCPEIESFPEGGLPSKLQSVDINKCQKLVDGRMQWPEQPCFPRSKSMEMGNCCNLEWLPQGMHSLLSSLEELKLYNCPKLLSVPSHLPSLKQLWIVRCGQLESLVGSAAAATTTRRTSDPLYSRSLTSLQIEGCSELVSFPRGELHAPNLKSMKIEDCGNLKSLPQGMHSLLSSLEELVISSCPEIESFPEGGLPSKLQSIEIFNCEKLVGGCMKCRFKSMIIGYSGNLKWLPQGMHSLLSSLEELKLYNCPKLLSVPNHLPSLKRLWIVRCGMLESLVGSAAAAATTRTRTSDPLFSPTLASLHIEGCSELVSFPRGELDAPNLKSMKIEECGNLKWLPQGTHSLLSSLEELELYYCSKLLSVPTHLPSLKQLRIGGCGELLDIENLLISACATLETVDIRGSERMKCMSVETFPNLKELEIGNCSNLESLGSAAAAATTRTSDPLFSLSLTSLPIEGVSELVSFPRGELHAPNLKSMKIEDCGNLKWLPQGMHSLNSSLELELYNCPKLLCVPTHLPNLIRLRIRSCGELESLGSTVGAATATPTTGTTDPLCSPSLTSLQIEGCSESVSFPRGELHAPNLKSMDIEECGNLKSLPSFLPSLKELRVSNCPEIESFPEGVWPSKLQSLEINSCEKLVSFSRGMHSLEELKLHNSFKLFSVPPRLPSLKQLRISGSSELDFKNLLISTCGTLETMYVGEIGEMKCISVETFPNLKELEIFNCFSLNSLVFPLFFPSLTSLSIKGCYNLESFPREGLHAPNLKIMEISLCFNFKSLPQGMHSLLPSLERLSMSYCPEIKSFPDGGLPSSLSWLHIICCPLLEKRCEWEIGEDWPKIKHIPHIIIR